MNRAQCRTAPLIGPETRAALGLATAFGIVLAGASCSGAQRSTESSQGRSTTFAFVDATVLPMAAGDSMLTGRTVLVRDGRIASIEPSASANVPAGVPRVNARGHYLMPGLVDAHVHLEYFDDPDILALFLAAGVTTVRNMDGRPYILEWKRSIASGLIAGPTIFTAGPILDGSPPTLDDNTAIRTADEARAAVAAQDSAGYDFVKTYIGLSAELHRAVLAAARERGMPVAGHVPRRVSLQEVIASTQHSIEHLADFDELIESDSSPVRGRFDWTKLYLAMPADDAKITRAAQQAAASQTWIVPTAIQADRALAPRDSLGAWLALPEMAFIPAEARSQWERQATGSAARMDAADWPSVARGRANRRALLRALHAAGSKVALGTDTPNAFVVPGFSVHDELSIFVDAGYTPREALRVATHEAARLLGVSDSVGTVQPGQRADLVLLAENPLLDIRAARRPLGVMARGRWIPATALDSMVRGLRGK